MEIKYLKKIDFLPELIATSEKTINFVVIVTSVLPDNKLELAKQCLKESARVLKDDGIIFIQGLPQYLPALGEFLMNYLTFKYWIAIESIILKNNSGLPSSHGAVLLFSKNNNKFNINKVRFSHQYCLYCNRTVKDWGGKSHLMNPEGYAISDVWKALPRQNNYSKLSQAALKTILKLVNTKEKKAKGIIGPIEGLSFENSAFKVEMDNKFQISSSIPKYKKEVNIIDNKLLDIVHYGDAVEILKKYPSNSVDLAFADPPYNLSKSYTNYDDELEDKKYIDWCNSWLREYIRVLKPTGSLYIVNVPKWGIYHASFLNKYLYFQNWIVWDAISEPRGKIMPAHYALLFYTKQPTGFTFNYEEVNNIDSPEFCLRQSCIKKRKREGIDPKIPLTDIWWDIHRIKHKKDRDMHPCQLPEKLLDRIILISTNKGDIVLDALCGTGTAPVTALKLGRRYIAIDIDKKYVEITEKKISEINEKGYLERKSKKKYREGVTKKELQLELKDLTLSLGKLPSEEDIERLSKFNLKLFKDKFPTWGKALKAAKLGIKNGK
jgi:site-specific DNA-methyltransferase (adenine-specific)